MLDARFLPVKAKSSHKHAGFTLIEMSIVLVVIGLLIGGVLVGKSLIRQTQINSVATVLQRMNKNTFRL